MKALNTYFASVCVAAILFAAMLDWNILLDLSTRDWMGLGAFLLLAVLSQALAVDSTLGAAKPVKSSIAFLPLLALAVVMPAPAVVVATGSMTAVHEIFFRERNWFRAGFNTAQTAISYGVAAIVFSVLARAMGLKPELGAPVDIANLFFPFYGLAITFFVLNLFFVSTAIAIRQAQPVPVVLREAVGRGGGNLLFDLLASPTALFAAFLYESFYMGGLFIAVLPFLVIRHAYLSAIQLKQANADLLHVLVKAIETRDPYTSGHSLRVSTLAQMIAADYGLRATAIENVKNAALLHDIGKIDAIYADIISKASELTEEERRIIRTHATKGADLLQSLTLLGKDVIVGVRHHHERYDGSGYPDGLSGKNIPLAARIIMICDSVDAMLSDRPYRDALPVSSVHAELRRCAGSQFDPELVKTILDNNTLERAEKLVDRSGAKAPIQAIAI